MITFDGGRDRDCARKRAIPGGDGGDHRIALSDSESRPTAIDPMLCRYRRRGNFPLRSFRLRNFPHPRNYVAGYPRPPAPPSPRCYIPLPLSLSASDVISCDVKTS